MALGDPAPTPLVLEHETTAIRDGQLAGIGGWFSADLGAEVGLTNAPGDEARIDRPFALYPVDPPLTVRAGDRVRVEMRTLVAERTGAWTAEVTPKDGGPVQKRRHSTLDAVLVGVESLRREHARRPRLGPRGEARSTVLLACDGEHSEAALADLLVARHPESFRHLDAALQFVREVIAKDCLRD